MNANELDKKIQKIRMVTDAKLKYLKQHARLLNQAFEELDCVTNEELDFIHHKIAEIDKRMDKNGLTK